MPLNLKFAKLISRIFDPIIESPIIIFLAIQSTPTLHSVWILFLITLSLIYLIPILYFFISLKKKWVSDIDVTIRQQRYPLFGIIFLLMLVTIYLYHLLDEDMLLTNFFQILLPFFIFFLITFFWKISGHVFINSVLMILIYRLYLDPIIIPLSISLLALVGWSRIMLNKHTLTQVLAGALLALMILI